MKLFNQIFNDVGTSEFTGVFRGDGVSHDGKPVQAQFIGETILGGQAFRLQFVANDAEGILLHEEETILSQSDLDAKLRMYNFNMHTKLTALDRAVPPQGPNADSSTLWQFSTNNLEKQDAFRMRVTLRRVGADALEYAYEWGMPGQDFAPRTAVALKRFA